MLRGTLPASSTLPALPWKRRSVKASHTMGSVGLLIRFFALLFLGIFFGLPLVWLILSPTKTDVQLTQSFPLSVGSFAKIKDLLASARIDGANEWQRFWNVGLPLSRPLLGLLVFLNFTATWNNYFLPFVMLQDTPIYNLPVGLQALIAGTSALHPGTSMNIPIHRAELAFAGVLMVLPVAIVFLFSQRFVTSGVLTGSVKD